MRNPRVLEELSKRSQYSNNRNRNSGFFNGDFRNGLNEGTIWDFLLKIKLHQKFFLKKSFLFTGYDGTGPGFRIRYSQLQNCFDGSFVLN